MSSNKFKKKIYYIINLTIFIYNININITLYKFDQI